MLSFIYVWLCCENVSLVAVGRLLLVVASLVAEPRF